MPTVVAFETLPELFLNLTKKYEGKQKTAFARKPKTDAEYETINWDQVSEDVHTMAAYLVKHGIEAGDRVALLSENRYEWAVVDLALQIIGGVNVSLYTSLPPKQCEYILQNSEAELFFVSTGIQLKKAREVFDNCENLRQVIAFDEPNIESYLDEPYVTLYEKVMAEGLKAYPKLEDEIHNRSKSIEPEDLATLIYTSGTTGDPKGVMLTHNNIASNLLASLERVPFDETVREHEKMLSYLPLSHVFERMITYMYLRLGYPIYYIEEIDQIRDDFEYVKPFYFATVPRLLEKIHTGIKVKGQELSGIKKQLYYWAIHRAEDYDPENPPSGLEALKHKLADKLVYSKIRELFGGNLLGVVSGGAALSPNLFRFMNALGLICLQGYGLTETSPVLSVHDKDHMRVGSSGKPLSNVEVKIAKDGEILAKGPNVMQGYYNNPEKTEEVFTDDGWFMTGDVGKMEDDYLFITDRKKSVFKLSTGKYIAPQTIENRLIESGYIDQAVVIGFNRKFCSALIVPSYDNVERRLKSKGKSYSDDLSTDPEVRKLIQKEVDKVNRNLSPWETVKKFVLLSDAFTIESGELTPTQKVKRPIVHERYKDEIESMYEDQENPKEVES